MARQFYDGYPRFYANSKRPFDECNKDEILCNEFDNVFNKKCKDDCKCNKNEHHEFGCGKENNDCCAHTDQDCSCSKQNFLSGLNLDCILNNFNIDDIILLAIVLVLLHDGTEDTLLLLIIGVIFLVGLI